MIIIICIKLLPCYAEHNKWLCINIMDNDSNSHIINRQIGSWLVNTRVFIVSALAVVALIVVTLFALDSMADIYEAVRLWVVSRLGWWFVLIMTLFVIFNVVLALTRFGKVRIGGQQARPDYSFVTWFAMLFSAGMGIGLLFWSVAEPISHFMNPPYGTAHTTQAAELAMRFTFLHWGLQAWAVYGIVALSLAYFTYNRRLPFTIRSAFYPLLGRRIYGIIGDIIDILAVVATMFGLATSLGLGASQIGTGLHVITGVHSGLLLQIILIVIITAIASLSVFSGLDRGIKRLSQLNLGLAGLLALFVLLLGPTLFILHLFVQTVGDYIDNFAKISLWTDTFSNDNWQEQWTTFYWAWWISWSPYVGMFIARVSYGRSIREFLLGVLLVPTILTFAWLAIFGGTAIHGALNETMNIVAAVKANTSDALFNLLSHFPFHIVTSTIAVLSVVIFFVTSSDSGALVIDIITAGGSSYSHVTQRIFWACAVGVIAIVLLLGGGLTALQTASITTGLPFSVILVFMCYSLIKALRQDHPHLKE